jgi:ABC-2 type transport system ATP-binding protein
MIKVTDLYKSFGDRLVIGGISFEVGCEIYGLLGPNGSGKSTLMKIIAGVLKPSGGDVSIGGISVAEDPVKVKEVTGYVPETPVLYESLTPAELFDFVGKIRRIPAKLLEDRVNSFVDAFDIREYLDQFIGTLSFGTKQKVSIITAFLHDPEILILDEVMNGLDVKSAKILRELLFEFKKSKSIIFSTHVLPIAEMMCDRIGVIYRGKIIAEGNIDELKESLEEKNLEDLFLRLTESKDDIYTVVQALKSLEV